MIAREDSPMNKLMYSVVLLGGFAVLYGVGRTWRLKPESKYDHRLLSGEIAVVKSPRGGEVWLALDKHDCYSLNVAMSKGDSAHLKACEDKQTAFAVSAGTFVKVIGESVSRVRVEVMDGTSAGRQGWVEFQYLRPRQPGEFR
jgi:hypothetical protein